MRPSECRLNLDAAPGEENDSLPMSSQKRVLVSEGSSLSAWEAVTALGMAGHQVGVCDPNRFVLDVSRDLSPITTRVRRSAKFPGPTWMLCCGFSPMAAGTCSSRRMNKRFCSLGNERAFHRRSDSRSQISHLSFRSKERLPLSGLLSGYPLTGRNGAPPLVFSSD